MGRDGRGVKKASESSIEIAFTYQGVRCRERIALKPTPPNLKRAEQHRAAILHAITTGTFDYATTFPESPKAALFARQAGDIQSVGVYLEKWIEGKRKHLKASTFKGYQKIVDHQLIPWFGETMLSDMSKKIVRTKLDELDAGNKTLANIQSVLRSALDDAIEAELIENNPLAAWRYKKIEPPKETDDIDPFTVSEQSLILDSLTGQGRNLIQFAFWTGLRTSELVALDWGDIDWQRGEIRISRAMTQAAEEAEVTKTVAGKRDIKILRSAMEALEAQKAFTYLKGQEVFQNPRTGERWDGDQPIRKTLWTHALKLAKVRYRRPYQTRHTYASMMLSAGEHPMWVAKQMGHKDWTMIARIYGRWMPDADTGAGSKAELLFGANDKVMTTTTPKAA